jgi:hypothetical protein
MLKSSLTRSIPHFPGISLAFLVSTPFREAGLPQRASWRSEGGRLGEWHRFGHEWMVI